MKRPDVVLFMLDQLAARWLESPCDTVVPTPHLDRLRARGVNFTRCIAGNPICMPARATIATGLSARGHGVLTNGYRLDPELPTFMSLLQGSGYRTGVAGKVHFRPHFAGLYPDYTRYGFDIAHVTEDARGGEWLDWVAERHPRHFEAVLATIWPSHIPEYSAYGPRRENLKERIEAIRESFQWATPEYPHNTPRAYTLPFPAEVSQTEWITGHGVDFLRDTPADTPLLLQVSYVQPHGPFCPPASTMDRVAADRIPAPAPVEWVDDPSAPECFATSEGARRAIPDDWRRTRHYYFADLGHLDDQLGHVMDALEQRGRLDDTYFILVADHGELLLDHGFTGKGERHYDAAVRVPLTIAGPGLQRGATVDRFVQHEDLFPTILEMASVEAPAPRTMGPYLRETPEALAGSSLLPLCRGEQPAGWRDAAYVESYNNISTATPRNWARSVRTSDWRYTRYPNGTGEQLFHLAEDPDEQHNLAADPAHAAVRNELRDRLLDLVILQDYPHSHRDLFALGVH